MLSLYSSLLLMTMGALSILLFGFRKELFTLQHYMVLLLLVVCSLGMYQLSGEKAGLYQWLQQGSSHYALMAKVDDLGGLEGMIEKVRAKLALKPDDKEGWSILSKLYTATGEKEKADEARAKSV